MSIENHIENVFKRIRTRFSGSKRRSASVDASALENLEDGDEQASDGARASMRKVRYTARHARSHNGKENPNTDDVFTRHRSSNDLYTPTSAQSSNWDRRRSRSRGNDANKHHATIKFKDADSQDDKPLAERLRVHRQALRPTTRDSPEKQKVVRTATNDPQVRIPHEDSHKLQPIHTVGETRRPREATVVMIGRKPRDESDGPEEIPASFSRNVVNHRPARRHHSINMTEHAAVPNDNYVQLDRTTHFPVNGYEHARTSGNGYRRDAYGGYLLDDRVWNVDATHRGKGLVHSEPLENDVLSHGESGYGSGGGYTSGLEINIPARSGSLWSTTATESPLSSNTDRYGRSPPLLSPRSVERLDSSSPTIPQRYAKKALSSLGSPKSLEALDSGSPEFQRKRRVQAAKSEAYLHRLQRTANERGAVQFLQSKVTETKYVTAAFEARNGLAPILDDIMNEFSHWLGARSRLLAVACEVHWSVPEKSRSRIVEIRMKESLHRVLRDNNRRVLNLYDNCRDHLPLSFIESKIEENCAHDSQIDAFQGPFDPAEH
ncbi:Protein CDH-10 [Aphelenchoides avenae]|nr:Protein CDH-10 [Aphelenchus avenae]